MISVDLIRKQTDLVQEKLTCKGENISLDNLLKLDGEYREHLSKANDLRAERNKASEDIAKAKRAGQNANEAISAMRSIRSEEQRLNSSHITISYAVFCLKKKKKKKKRKKKNKKR